MVYEISLEENPSPEDLAVLHHGLGDYADSIFGPTVYKDITFFLRDPKGKIAGGVHGNYGSFNWIYIGTLWVAGDVRGGGYGTRLMDLIEQAGIDNGCTNAFLNTFSFQAPEFYKKRDYIVFAELEDFPVGHSRFFLRKRLI
jgi:GNAT superfamily N-acetyltransferase